MKLLSGNPDGFAFVFKFLSKKKGNRSIICCPELHRNSICQQKTTPACDAGVVNNLKGPTKLPGLYNSYQREPL